MRNSFGREAEAAPQAGFESIEGGILAQKSLQFLMHLFTVLRRQCVEGLNENNHRRLQTQSEKATEICAIFSCGCCVQARHPVCKNYPIEEVFRR